ncbi:LysR family transcriptional regulator [Solimicrobium silvestre]|uniref:Transcriptional regulator n=1 Tax=Solimicrobium silvestre TaxID=2099400 RepID=A0A2S9GX70_9BURK|nr:LysR family transcriptional regulator [Solimicrobium silvestre]PRC92300.1 Transcriptional regulator [Solimicrobium silvestre]
MISHEALNVFVEAANSGSFSAAARKLGKRQSTVSEAIANLEIDLGVSLFDRRTRRPTLTAQGRSMLVHAQQVLEAQHRLSIAARLLVGGQEAQLSFALSDTYQSNVFEVMLKKIEQRFPDLQLECLIAEDHDAVELVQENRVQLALITAQAEYPPDISFDTLSDPSEIGLFVSAGHALTNQSTISNAMLSATRELRLNTFADDAYSKRTSLSWSSSNYLILLEMTELGFGWAKLPRWLVKRFAETKLVELRTGGWPRQIPMHVIWSRQHNLGPAACWMRDNFLTSTVELQT